MSLLRIHLFGSVRVAHEGRSSVGRLTHAVQGLLAYLVLHRRRLHARETLSGLFWGDHSEPRARSCLSTTLWRLRQVLEPDGIVRGTYLIAGSSAAVGFNFDSEHWIDAEVFELEVTRALATGARRELVNDKNLGEALRLYTGDILDAHFADWALAERERLRLLYLSGLTRLMHHQADRGFLDEACASARCVLEVDPLREEVHRELMRLQLRRGDRAAAIRQYRTCREVLARELGVPPMEETRALHARIVADSPAPLHTPGNAPVSSALESVLEPLHLAAEALEQVRAHLQLAVRFASRGGHSGSPSVSESPPNPRAE
ncbi:MAG: BTAD domain-containing putative transcriptional regulator [Gemmatimonadaceae bacterium]